MKSHDEAASLQWVWSRERYVTGAVNLISRLSGVPCGGQGGREGGRGEGEREGEREREREGGREGERERGRGGGRVGGREGGREGGYTEMDIVLTSLVNDCTE